ncbi:MAG TPA: hypothetical protein VEY12_00660 [Thermoplasmata archaeon]|nr:hypothetical protein [Thermoplasmata archaeon]
MGSVRQIVVKLAQRVNEALVGRDLEPLRATVTSKLRGATNDLEGIDGDAFPESVLHELVRTRLPEGMHVARIPARIAGASFVTTRFGGGMTPANHRRAWVAKALYEFLQDLLDDVLDSGSYSFDEARQLYAVCGESLTEAEFDPARFREELARLLRGSHKALAPLLATLSAELNPRLRASPSGGAIFAAMARMSERLGIAQSATIYLRRPTLDLAAAQRIASELPSADPEAPWFERLGAYASWVLAHALIDLCFLDEPMTPEDVAALEEVWYHMNVELSFIDHVAGLEKDLRDGIYNFAWAAIRETRPDLDVNSTLPIPREDQARIVALTAEFANRAIKQDAAHFGKTDGFYPFLAILGPVVLTAPGTGNDPWVLDCFLRAFGSLMRTAEGEGGLGP